MACMCMQEMNTKKELKKDFGIFFYFVCDKNSRKISFWLASCLMRLQFDTMVKAYECKRDR